MTTPDLPPTLATLRDRIAGAIHGAGADCEGPSRWGSCQSPSNHLDEADAVVDLLELAEEQGQRYSAEGSAMGEVVLPGVDAYFEVGSVVVARLIGPWHQVTDTPINPPAS